ncbi:uncharacterized mitochondrial protein-like protein [Tanacetum coccineum]
MVPKAVLMKSGLVSVNTAKQVNVAHIKTTLNAARPMLYLSKKGHSTVKRPIHKNTIFKNSNFNQRVNIVKDKNVNTVLGQSSTTKDETSGILKSFITGIENLVDHKVKVIRCDNGTEFKNKEMNQFCEMKEAVNTACYVQNRVLVVKPHNKTSYELFHGRTPTLSFMRPFGCPVTILNTIDHLGKFDGKADEGFFVGYSLNSKAFRVLNSRTRILEENLHIRFNESTPIVIGTGPNYDDGKKVDDDSRKDSEGINQEKEDNINSTNNVNAASTNEVNDVDGKTSIELLLDPNMHELEDYSLFNSSRNDEDDGAEADMNNLDTTIQVSPNPTTRIHKDHPLDQVIGYLQLGRTQKGFEDPDFPDRVYKVEKALYGLHQAPRAWYETLSTYLLDNEFQRGKIDKTLFIKRYKGDILLMSSMEELTFFLGLQVQQKKDSIFISQDNYVDQILKKFGFTEVKTASTPIETQKPFIKDKDGEEVDVHMYRSMIGSLMYLTSSRPNIMFAVCACARYQANLKVSHLHAMKRIFSDYTGASLDRKSTTGGCQFLGCRLISWQCKKQIMVANSTTEAKYVAASSCCEGSAISIDPHHTPTFIQPSTHPQKTQQPRKPKIKDTQVPQPSDPTENVADEAVHKELGDSLVRAATTASSLEAEQDSANINKTQSKATPNESSSQGTNSGDGPW